MCCAPPREGRGAGHAPGALGTHCQAPRLPLRTAAAIDSLKQRAAKAQKLRMTARQHFMELVDHMSKHEGLGSGVVTRALMAYVQAVAAGGCPGAGCGRSWGRWRQVGSRAPPAVACCQAPPPPGAGVHGAVICCPRHR